jgi:hypothetical protein
MKQITHKIDNREYKFLQISNHQQHILSQIQSLEKQKK